jgi:PEP-CTERM motif
MRRSVVLVAAVAWTVLGLAALARANNIEYVYTDTQLGNSVKYTLDLTGAGCPTNCAATFTIDITGAGSQAYLGTLVWKFGGSTLADLTATGLASNPVPPAIPTGWDVVKDSNTDNTANLNACCNQGGIVPSGGFYGFYNQNFLTNKVALGTPGTYTFTFDILGIDSNIPADSLSLHNAYYTIDAEGVPQFDTILSVTAPGGNTPVPEPGSLILAGSGLVGITAWGRRRWTRRSGNEASEPQRARRWRLGPAPR